MKTDILTVVWKEWRAIFRVQGGRSRILMVMFTPILLAVVMPITFDDPNVWIDGFFSILVSIIVPMLIVAVTIPDSFAGERERNTLETLLASRLPDRSILFGKWIVSVIFALAITYGALILGLVTVNIKFWGDGLLFYSLIVGIANIVLSILMATVVAGAGILISLRAKTVQGAAQTLMMIFLLPLVLFQVVAMLFLRQIIEYIESVDGTIILLIVVGVLLVLDVIVNFLAVNRFQRSKLILV